MITALRTFLVVGLVGPSCAIYDASLVSGAARGGAPASAAAGQDVASAGEPTQAQGGRGGVGGESSGGATAGTGVAAGASAGTQSGGGVAAGGSPGEGGVGGVAAPVLGPDITAAGTPIALVTDPTGAGRHDLEVLRDGDMPPVGSEEWIRQYDTFTGPSTRTEDWLGYTFGKKHTFMRVVFQNGGVFPDGGWFDSIKLQVRNAGVWADVASAVATPSYPGQAGQSFVVYQFDFDPTRGDGVRVVGTPGGSGKFVSCAELRVFEGG